jgi:O-antigen ligase
VPLFGWLDRPRRALVLSATAAITVVRLRGVLFLPAASSLRERAVSVEPVSGRLLMYEIGAELALERPLTGYGSGGPSRRARAPQADGRGGAGADLAPGQFHDTFLMTASSGGFPACWRSVAILGLFIRAGFALRRQTGDATMNAASPMCSCSRPWSTWMQCLLVDTPPFLYLNGVYFFLAGVVFAQLDARAGTAAERASDLRLPATAPA